MHVAHLPNKSPLYCDGFGLLSLTSDLFVLHSLENL